MLHLTAFKTPLNREIKMLTSTYYKQQQCSTVKSIS